MLATYKYILQNILPIVIFYPQRLVIFCYNYKPSKRKYSFGMKKSSWEACRKHLVLGCSLFTNVLKDILYENNTCEFATGNWKKHRTTVIRKSYFFSNANLHPRRICKSYPLRAVRAARGAYKGCIPSDITTRTTERYDIQKECLLW